MKKLGKFLFGTVVIASIAAGAYYLYKHFIKKNSDDDFDDFEDDFENIDDDEADSESREYVPINIAPDETSTEASEELTDMDEKDMDPEDEL